MSLLKAKKETNSPSKKKKAIEFIDVINKNAYDTLVEFIDAKTKLKDLKGKLAAADSYLKEKALKIYSEKIEDEGKIPGSSIDIRFKNKDGDAAQFKFQVKDQYSAVNEHNEEDLTEEFGEDIIQTVETYSFNTALLEKHYKKIQKALDKLDIPEEDKENLIILSEKKFVKKGSIEKVIAADNTLDAIELLSPVQAVTYAKISK